MKSANNISVTLAYNLNHYKKGSSDNDDDLYHVVVQKGNVGSRYVYALQLLHKGHNIYVFRGDRQSNVSFDKNNPVLRLIGQETIDKKEVKYTAGGHTQTWEYANQSGDWFVGTKPNEDGWDKQIARVHIPITSKMYNNTDLPRLSYLNRAGYQQGINYAGSNMERVEAAVTPDYEYFMIASVDTSGTGYFSLYYLSDINTALNNVGTSDVNIQNITCQKAFKIPDFQSEVGSIQGYDVSNKGKYIYVSSQYSPEKSARNHDNSRKIVKIPWGETNSSNWEKVDLTNNGIFDESDYKTEFEGIQLVKDNDLYLTVAYHDPDNNEETDLTVMNRIYRITWDSNLV